MRHIVSLSFDDGFKKSFSQVAEIFENFGLSACLNVIATGHRPSFVPPDDYHIGYERGNFELWNKLQERGHEIMPHSLKHDNLGQIPFTQAQEQILQCLEIFSRDLKGFDPKGAVYNFAYNQSTPELEGWLPTVVRAFRTGGAGINPLPYDELVKLTTTGFGPANCEHHLDQEIDHLLSQPNGWLIYNLHGLDDEGWGPIRASYLEDLLSRLTGIDSVRILPTGRAILSAR